MQKTLLLIKPDAIQRGLVGNVISRFETKGLKLVAMKMMALGDTILEEHYSHIADKPFFPPIVRFMRSTPVVAMVWEGKSAISVVRTLVGATNAREADIGTIRGDLAMSIQCNVVHASDGEEAAAEEMNRFFNGEEIFHYDKGEYLNLYTAEEKGV